MYKNAFELQVLVNGRPVKELLHNSQTYIEARKGTNYTIQLKNKSNRKALAILSLDGIDVIKGRRGEDAQSGYIVDPYSTIEVKGYRISDEEVAAFVFSDGFKSYANTIGAKTEGGTKKTTKNNGVIGARITLEKEPEIEDEQIDAPYTLNPIPFRKRWPRIYPPYDCPPYDCPPYDCPPYDCPPYDPYSSPIWNTCDTPLAMFSCKTRQTFHSDNTSKEIPKFELGTTYGEKIQDKVIKTTFNKSNEAFDIVLYYASRDSLIKAGIDFCNSKKVYVEEPLPKAFGDLSEYCPIP
jgi:hypothetical protein